MIIDLDKIAQDSETLKLVNWGDLSAELDGCERKSEAMAVLDCHQPFYLSVRKSVPDFDPKADPTNYLAEAAKRNHFTLNCGQKDSELVDSIMEFAAFADLALDWCGKKWMPTDCPGPSKGEL